MRCVVYLLRIEPYITLGVLAEVFGADQIPIIVRKYLNEPHHHHYEFKHEYVTLKGGGTDIMILTGTADSTRRKR